MLRIHIMPRLYTLTLVVSTVVLALGCAPSDTGSHGIRVGDTADPRTSWPERMRATFNTTQTPRPLQRASSAVIIANTSGVLEYDWEGKWMHVSFAPHCPALMSPAGGSEFPCEYYFVDHDLYYIYQDQYMTIDRNRSLEQPSCCVIEGFSMAGRHFPGYVEQWGEYMKSKYGSTCVVNELRAPFPADDTVLVAPGGSFYAFHSNARPSGFGSKTVHASYTNTRFATFEIPARDAVHQGLAVPEICDNAPPCANCNVDGSCSEQNLTAKFARFNKPRYGGCVLCHNQYDDPVFPVSIMSEFDMKSCSTRPRE